MKTNAKNTPSGRRKNTHLDKQNLYSCIIALLIHKFWNKEAYTQRRSKLYDEPFLQK